MYNVYILKSKKSDKYYIGFTKDIEIRLKQHNFGKVRYTKSYIPWKTIYVEKIENKIDAIKREKQIKSYKGGEAFKKLIKK